MGLRPVVACYLTLLVQYRIFRVRQFLMLFGLGVSIDSLLTVLGVFQFGPTLFFIPLWLVLLWAAFTTTLFLSLKSLAAANGLRQFVVHWLFHSTMP